MHQIEFELRCIGALCASHMKLATGRIVGDELFIFPAGVGDVNPLEPIQSHFIQEIVEVGPLVLVFFPVAHKILLHVFFIVLLLSK